MAEVLFLRRLEDAMKRQKQLSGVSAEISFDGDSWQPVIRNVVGVPTENPPEERIGKPPSVTMDMLFDPDEDLYETLAPWMEIDFGIDMDGLRPGSEICESYPCGTQRINTVESSWLKNVGYDEDTCEQTFQIHVVPAHEWIYLRFVHQCLPSSQIVYQ